MMSDADRECLGCGGTLVDRLELPGGRVVDEDRVPFGDSPAGVDAVVECRNCGNRPDKAH